MKQMTFDEIRDFLKSHDYSDLDVIQFVWDNIKFRHGRFFKYWICELAYEKADLNDDHDCNDCYYFGSGIGSYDASRNPQEALMFFIEKKFDHSEYQAMCYLVDQFNCLSCNDDCYWQDALEDC